MQAATPSWRTWDLGLEINLSRLARCKDIELHPVKIAAIYCVMFLISFFEAAWDYSDRMASSPV